MKRLFISILMAVWMFSLTGCESDYSNNFRLTFENASRFTVQVIPLTTEWGGFSVAPGEIVKLDDIRDVDYRFEPADNVQEGSASTERYIIFVDAAPE
ncbi:MAG: hypothetical protein KKC51_11460 [Verrucomicrobia bacterium]|nr:hypothetical protein [Verrucomicrobiota bacterium]